MTDFDALLLGARTRPRALEGPLGGFTVEHAVACSDDLWFGGVRHTVRAFITPGPAGTCIVDLRDSSAAELAPGGLALDADEVRLAAVLAFADAMRLPAPDLRLAQHIELRTDATTWVGAAGPTGDAAVRSFGIARVYDAICGALALAWPAVARAGSCSLGAIVMATDARGGALLDVVPGGRGAAVDEPGTSAWPGPLVAAGTHVRSDTVDVEHLGRSESGGGGARSGGDGMIARYRFGAPARVRVAIDRIVNPPHGLDRAGPPSCSTLARVLADDRREPLAAWQTHVVAAGDTLEVCTAGGAGHGFGGWGVDFDWE